MYSSDYNMQTCISIAERILRQFSYTQAAEQQQKLKLKQQSVASSGWGSSSNATAAAAALTAADTPGKVILFAFQV
jgi:homoserine kinase